MQLRVDRAELLNELGPMQGVVERKTTIPVLSHILLTARDEKLQIAATDLDVSLTSWTRADVEEEGGIAVQARKFLEIIRALPEAEVQLLQEDPKILTIKAGQTPVHRYLGPLLERIGKGEIDPSFVITHRITLDETPEAYRAFTEKADDAIKIVVKP